MICHWRVCDSTALHVLRPAAEAVAKSLPWLSSQLELTEVVEKLSLDGGAAAAWMRSLQDRLVLAVTPQGSISTSDMILQFYRHCVAEVHPEPL